MYIPIAMNQFCVSCYMQLELWDSSETEYLYKCKKCGKIYSATPRKHMEWEESKNKLNNT